jgi:D-alanine-D-alanine ligase
MKNRTIGVLMGGMSSEREVSLRSGEAVLAALTQRGYRALPIYVDRDVDRVLRQSSIDVAFIALHGRYGEDGCVQGLLEVMGIPYTGSDVLASALARHKVKSKELFGSTTCRLPHCRVRRRRAGGHDPRRFRLSVRGQAGARGQLGRRTIVPASSELAASRPRGASMRVLVERYIAGQEVSVAVLGDRLLGAVG